MYTAQYMYGESFDESWAGDDGFSDLAQADRPLISYRICGNQRRLGGLF